MKIKLKLFLTFVLSLAGVLLYESYTVPTGKSPLNLENKKGVEKGGIAENEFMSNEVPPYTIVNLYPTGIRRTSKDKSYEKYPFTKMSYNNIPINEPKGIVVHFTNTKSDDDAIKILSDTTLDGGRCHGTHFLIGCDRNEITVFNDTMDIAPHAGHSYFLGQPDVNNFMEGIEFQGNARHLLTLQQKADFAYFLKKTKWNEKIPIENIVTHKQVRNNYIQQYGVKDKNGKIKTDYRGYSKTKNPHTRIEEWINSATDLTDEQYEDLINYLYSTGVYMKQK